jgi:hypothetical protein
VRRILIAVLVLGVALPLAGCGWLRAGSVSHTKPSGFVLRGYATAGIVAAPGTGAGGPCQAPSAGVAPNDEVFVADPPGKTLATGMLGVGVLAVDGTAYRCNFPFEISGVPGGHQTYEISIAGRAAVSFPAEELRHDKPAVIPVGS